MLLALLLLVLPLSAADKPCGKGMKWKKVSGTLWDLRGLQGGPGLSAELAADYKSGALEGSDPVLVEKSGRQRLIVTGWPGVGYTWPSPWLEARYNKVKLKACVMPGEDRPLFSPSDPEVVGK